MKDGAFKCAVLGAVLFIALCNIDMWVGMYRPGGYDAMTTVCTGRKDTIECPVLIFTVAVPLRQARLKQSGTYTVGRAIVCEWKRNRSYTGRIPIGPDMSSFICWP